MTEPRQTGTDFFVGSVVQTLGATPIPMQAGPEFHNYFQAVPHLNELRQRASQAVGPSACDLVSQLNREGLKAGFEPVGAFHQGITTDAFFQFNLEFQALEVQLARKITTENVSEVFELIKEADHYKPSGKVLCAIQRTYLQLIALSAEPSPTEGKQSA